VTFAARFAMGGQDQIHREISRFRKDDGRWLYVDGDANPPVAPRHVEKIGRNDPCPCGAGKKYKKCGGA
jgi:SEC-C motif-containing protein